MRSRKRRAGELEGIGEKGEESGGGREDREPVEKLWPEEWENVESQKPRAECSKEKGGAWGEMMLEPQLLPCHIINFNYQKIYMCSRKP